MPPTPTSQPIPRPTVPKPITVTNPNPNTPIKNTIIGKLSHSIIQQKDPLPINESDHPSSNKERHGQALYQQPDNPYEMRSTPTNPKCHSQSTHHPQYWPNNSITIISTLANCPSRTITNSNFMFSPSRDAATHNINTLRSFNFDLNKALSTEQHSFTNAGSEFRTTSELEPLLLFHPLWPRLKSHLSSGIKFPLAPLSHALRTQDLTSALAFGNHRGVTQFPQFFEKLNTTDITSGFSIPIPKANIHQIPGALLCPMNVVEQMTISETGELIEKQRACHDLSFPCQPSDSSVNSRVLHDEIPPCMFGYCLLRILHYIATLRFHHPSTPILIQKVDWKSAYKRVHLHHDTAVQCCSLYKDLVLIPLRAIFGGAPCPSEWGIISETTTDLANHILNHKDWDPSKINSPNQSKILPPKLLDSSIKFGQAKPMMVDIPLEKFGKADVYIDDTITVSLHSTINNSRASAAVPLAIHLMGRPLLPNEPIERSDLLCLRKLLAEGRLEEIKNTLGWDIDTRNFCVSLPSHKFKAWNLSITTILKTGSTTFKQLETLIGRLTHVSTIMPHILHFMGRLRTLCYSASKRRRVTIRLVHKEDLSLCQRFLTKAHQGIDINLIIFREPTHAYFSDACPTGIGGYNDRGLAWRWPIPKNLQYRATINMLEHVASIVGPWIDLLSDQLPPLSCSISLTDSTTSAGWLRKSNFSDTGENAEHFHAKLQVARSHATRFIDNDIREYSQWFPGKHNIIADSLSRDFHLSNKTLTSVVRSILPPQTRQLFTIAPLPQKIVSWLCAWLQQLPASHQLREEHQPSNLPHGIDGTSSYIPLIFPTTHSFNLSQQESGSSSYRHSHKPSGRQSSLSPQFIAWVRTQSEMPSIMWHRPSGTDNSPTQDSTQMGNLHDFYQPNTRATRTKIPLHDNRKPSRDASYSDSTRTEQRQDPEPSQICAQEHSSSLCDPVNTCLSQEAIAKQNDCD